MGLLRARSSQTKANQARSSHDIFCSTMPSTVLTHLTYLTPFGPDGRTEPTIKDHTEPIRTRTFGLHSAFRIPRLQRAISKQLKPNQPPEPKFFASHHFIT
jgi:hypothetical protein